MTEKVRKNDGDDTPRTGTEVESRDAKIPSRPAPRQEEEDVQRAAHVTDARSADQKEDGSKSER